MKKLITIIGIISLLGIANPALAFNGACPNYSLGDINCDGVVNYSDYLILQANYGDTVTPFTDGDLTGSGVVNFASYQILAAHFNQVVDETVPTVITGDAGVPTGFGQELPFGTVLCNQYVAECSVLVPGGANFWPNPNFK